MVVVLGPASGATAKAAAPKTLSLTGFNARVSCALKSTLSFSKPTAHPVAAVA